MQNALIIVSTTVVKVNMVELGLEQRASFCGAPSAGELGQVTTTAWIAGVAYGSGRIVQLIHAAITGTHAHMLH